MFGVAAGLILGLGGGLAGCIADNVVRVRSVRDAAVDSPRLEEAAYWAADASTADIYLTDLGPAELDPGTDLSAVEGRIVHLHMFVVPLAGATPIDPEACSVTVRHIVLARGSIGVYAGGGFLLPGGRPGDAEFGGRIRGGTLRLAGHTKNFVDRLGASTMDAAFTARKDEATAKRIAARVRDVLAAVEKDGG